MSWQTCPVCNGTGKVPRSFYPDLGPPGSSTADNYVECRSCYGRGVLQSTVYPPYTPKPPYEPHPVWPYGPWTTWTFGNTYIA